MGCMPAAQMPEPTRAFEKRLLVALWMLCGLMAPLRAEEAPPVAQVVEAQERGLPAEVHRAGALTIGGRGRRSGRGGRP